MMGRRTVTFSKAERARLAKACQNLGCFFEEFIHDATMQAVDEMEGPASVQLATERGWHHA